MKSIPTVGSEIAVTCRYLNIRLNSTEKYVYSTYRGKVIPNNRWNPIDTFTMTSDSPEIIPFRVISLASVDNLRIVSGELMRNSTRKFSVTGKSGTYIVTADTRGIHCTCIGFKYHHKCKHSNAIAERLKK